MSDKKQLSGLSQLSQATQVVHAGLENAEQGKPFQSGPVFASTFHHIGEVDAETQQYARFHNPTWQALESAIDILESGRSIIFPSGMSAVAATMTALIKAGDTILLPSDGYFASRAYANEFLAKFGVNIISVATNEMLEQDFTGITLVVAETPSNPMLDVIDIQQLADKVHAAGGLLAIDNTTMTPIGQQPLLLGADISICSDTKAFNGHSDVVFGHVATNNDALFDAMQLWRKLSGNIPGPMETWLIHRGLASLDLRLERMVNNAQTIAEWLAQASKVLSIRYPGLPDDPAHTLAKKQMQHFGFIISFDLGSIAATERFLQTSQLIFEATSFGGLHTMAERRGRWGTDDVPEGLIRLSVGCERVDDLLADLKLAMAAV